MRNFLVFILVLASKSMLACGFYPYGEELRFSFFNPDQFNYYSYSEFNYSANSFVPKEVYRANDIYPNDKLWFDYCDGKVDYASINIAVYSLRAEEIAAGSKNKMIAYLFKIKDFEALDYLKFAKSCEFFNTWTEDPWERNEVMVIPKRTQLLKKAIRFSSQCKKEEIKIRYTFLAIRVAFYNQDLDKIKKLYDSVFKNNPDDNILKYWSLYFRTLAEADKPLANYYAAQVFPNAPDKRFMVAQQYNVSIPIASVLKYAKTNQEKANVYLLAGIKSHDKSLKYLEKVYQYNPKFDGLGFLLLREVNKIEDWVFTSYYSLFSPSVATNRSWDSEEISIKNILKRVETDRVYAKQVLRFINRTDLTKVDDPVFWKLCKAYLLCITQDYDSSLALLDELGKTNSNPEAISSQLDIIKTLNLISRQEKGNAVILDEVKPLILKNKTNKKFLFALGRELEYKGNTSDAAFLYSKIHDNEVNEYHNQYNVAYWKTIKNQKDTYSDFYYDWFSYINVMYTPNQIENLIAKIRSGKNAKDEFSVWKQSGLKNEMARLYDLLGTKYIRQNNLEKALANFRKVNRGFWEDSYSNWEKNGNDGSNVFDKNPFCELRYTPGFIPVKDPIRLNKTSITNQLIRYINKANDVEEKDRDYYYFLVANCYFNMTQYGNSWMMRRYYWTSGGNHSVLEDEAEYYQCDLAKKYYLAARQHAKTDKFKALCLRMIGRCEKNRLSYQFPYEYGDNEVKDYDAYLLGKNRYYKDLKKNYGDYYGNLTNDCTYFEDYFKARR